MTVKYMKTKLDSGWWQICGVGDLRHTIYGTVEKVYGGWFAVAAGGEERFGTTLRESAEWAADRYRVKN